MLDGGALLAARQRLLSACITGAPAEEIAKKRQDHAVILHDRIHGVCDS